MAMVAHAAGESFFVKGYYNALEQGGIPPIPRCTVVVLAARDEAVLDELRRRLQGRSIPYVAFFESDPPYDGQLMSIGLVPGLRQDLREHLNDFALWPYVDPGDPS